MEKEIFENWNILKQKIENKELFYKFKEREICFVNLGRNIRSEENGKNYKFIRPVIVLKRFKNLTFIAIPLTSKVKNDSYHFEFNFLNKKSWAILSQIRVLDSKRIDRKIGYISKNDFILLKSKLKELIF